MTPDSPTSPKASHRILRKFAYLFSAHWVRGLLQTVFLIYLARYDDSIYGDFLLAINLGSILLFISEIGLNQHLATLLARRTDYPTAIVLQITLIKGALVTLSILGMLAFVFWQGYDPALIIMCAIIAGSMAVEALASSYFVLCQVMGRQDVEGKLRSLGAILGFGYGVIGLLAGMAPVLVSLFKLWETVINVGYAARAVLKRTRLHFDPSKLKQLWLTWREGIIYTLMAVAAIFYNKINMFFLKSYAGNTGVAQYGVTWELVDGISIMVSSMLLGRVMFPLFARLWISDKAEFHDLARQTARWLLAVAVPVMFVLHVESDRIIPVIYGDGYGHAVWMQKLLVPAIFCAFLHNLAAYLMISMQRQRLLLVFYVLGLAVNVALCLTLIPDDPLRGTVMAIVLTKLFVASLTVTYCQYRITIFPLATLGQAFLACGLGAALYWLGTAYVLREVGEVLALIPICVLAWRWKMAMKNPADAKTA
ncbi:MAG: polysaccharide biosynthesis protein [Desulfovibrio sp.]|nr:MAG: polysaccharide biosynthesis protein [Desulfovibrio sp.]